MKNSEEAHKVTEQIYRNLNDHFTPNLRQLSLSARNYYKALVGASTAAKTYQEALEKLGQDARNNCRGATQEIGDAIYQIAEVYREIQSQIEEQMKSLLNDLSFPLENKLENEFRTTVSSYKRYSQEHKAIAVPFEKAQVTLSKIQKKNKSRMTHSEKEVKYAQTVSRAQMRLHDHRMAGLQKAMLDEWKSYSFLLECLCSEITLISQNCNKTHGMIQERIEGWSQLCSATDTLPNSSSQMFQLVATGADLLNYTNPISNGQLRPGTSYMMPKHYTSHSKSLPDQMQPRYVRSPVGPSSSSQNVSSTAAKGPSASVQAIYPHSAKGDSQLSFQEGDIITLIGEKSDGWHYGYNANDRRYGWFPLSFTASLESSGLQNPPQPLSHRVKSMGDLLDPQDGQHWTSAIGQRRSSFADGNPPSASMVNEQPNSPAQKNAAAMYVSAASFSVPPSQLVMTPSSNIPPAPPISSPNINHNNVSAYSTGNVPVYSTSHNSNPANASSPTYKMRMSSSPPLPPPPLNFPPPSADYADAEDISHQMKRLTASDRMNQM